MTVCGTGRGAGGGIDGQKVASRERTFVRSAPKLLSGEKRRNQPKRLSALVSPVMSLDPVLLEDLSRLHQRLTLDGSLLSEPELDRCYATFASHFGPDVLRALDGPELADRLHNHSNRESLVYWLEFKDDEELPGRFGSIAGGSALKFGLYRRKETGAWMTGTSSAQRELSQDEAVAVARRHRDQLLAGADVLRTFQAGQGGALVSLQSEMLRVAPDVADTAWGHKYFSLLFPTLLDAYHVENYQQFHLIKLLQTPPPGGGRYAAAGQFVALAQQLGMHLQHLATVLKERHGRPHRYYRIGTGTEEVRRAHWPEMRDGGLVAVGWPALGDLSGVPRSLEGKESVRALMKQHYPNTPSTVGNQTGQLFRFVTRLEEGDWVMAADGATIVGLGRVKGPYTYTAGAEFPHRHAVEWMSLEEWRLRVTRPE
ncbi:MAG: hypothetical protein EOO70_06610, partial [Myxococcaceae bacterium]